MTIQLRRILAPGLLAITLLTLSYCLVIAQSQSDSIEHESMGPRTLALESPVELVVDGSFETDNEVWQQSSTHLPLLICDRNCDYEQTSFARTGDHWVAFGGAFANPEQATISQQLVVPSGNIITATLSFWLQIDLPTGTTQDRIAVWIDNAELLEITDADGNQFRDYRQVTVDVIDIVTHSSTLRFEVFLGPNSSTGFLLDDVSLIATIDPPEQLFTTLVPLMLFAGESVTPTEDDGDNPSPVETNPLSVLPQDTSLAFDNYLTLPDTYPTITITVPSSNTGEGYLFLANHHQQWNQSLPYLLILDNSGEPIYYQEMSPAKPVNDFKLQPNGQLTYWDAATRKHHALDATYSEVAVYEPANGLTADFHEFQITPDNHKLFLIGKTQIVDMSQQVNGGHPAARVKSFIIQELDENDELVFEWHSLDHIPVTNTRSSLTTDFIDYVHGNAIEVDIDGDLLFSSRHLDEVTKIDRETGDIIWRMGGKSNQFTFVDDDENGFSIQHDARRLRNGNITLLDNRREGGYSRAVEYEIDEENRSARLVWEHESDTGTHAYIMGNVQRLPNGNSLITWASDSPTLVEVRPDGRKAFELTLEHLHFTYRAFRFPWIGQPTNAPTLVVTQDTGSRLALHYSWNGATEVAAYEVYGDRSESPTTLLDTQPKTGFETRTLLAVAEKGFYTFRVVPLGSDGTPLIAREGAAGTIAYEVK